jgi:DNA-binding SARP family transcriptional activator
LDRIEQSKQFPCFVLAPRLSGFEELLANLVAASTEVLTITRYEVDAKGNCHQAKQPELSNQSAETAARKKHPPETAPRKNIPPETAPGKKQVCPEAKRVALIPFIPWLADEAARSLSNEIDKLVAQEYRVLVLCPLQNDRYQDLQRHRIEITASELKEVGLFSPAAYLKSFKQFIAEFLPLQIRLAAVLAAVLGSIELDEVTQLGFRLSGDIPGLLAQLHALFTVTATGAGLRSESLALPEIAPEISVVIREYLEEEGITVSASVLASRITMLSMALLQRGELEASHQILEIAETLSEEVVLHATLPSGPPHKQTAREYSEYAARKSPGLPFSYRTGCSAPLLALRLFGRLEVSLGGAQLINKQLTRTKVKRLLAFLALNQHRVVSRDNLIDYIWPSMDLERAQKNLYTTWCMLARGLGSQKVRACPYLIKNGEIYQLNPELVICDTDRFEQLARSVFFEQTQSDNQVQGLFELESLYRNCLVADLPPDGFINARMAGYRSLMVDALLMVTKQLRETGELEKALFCARSAYDLDDTREDVYRDLMDTQLEAGQRTSAMQTYFSCKQYLADELGILPSKRTTALYQDLLLDNCR